MSRFTPVLAICLATLVGCNKSANRLPPQTDDEPPSVASNVSQEPTVTDSPSATPDPTSDLHERANNDEHHGPDEGHRPGFGRGMARGRRGGFRPDMTTIHAMFDARDKISRKVKILPDGAEAITESDDVDVVSWIQEHVPSMESRVLGDDPLPPMTFHPIFVELIKNADKYTLDYEDTDKGVRVTYASDDPFVVTLVQEHAKLVSRFIENGMSEIHKPYELPARAKKSPEERANAAKNVLVQRLSGRLAEVMQSKGPVAAIEVCSKEASQIAHQVGVDYGVTIGRTSHKLRNASNAPPEWARPLIAKRSAEAELVDLTGDRVGALFPIQLQATCLLCHGPKRQIAPDVISKLAELYPEDNATGFRFGELRGWFWVEVQN